MTEEEKEIELYILLAKPLINLMDNMRKCRIEFCKSVLASDWVIEKTKDNT